eukprot:jgi/Botrbrau1/17447/Bobra.0054s0036.1
MWFACPNHVINSLKPALSTNMRSHDFQQCPEPHSILKATGPTARIASQNEKPVKFMALLDDEHACRRSSRPSPPLIIWKVTSYYLEGSLQLAPATLCGENSRHSVFGKLESITRL